MTAPIHTLRFQVRASTAHQVEQEVQKVISEYGLDATLCDVDIDIQRWTSPGGNTMTFIGEVTVVANGLADES